MTTTAQHDPQEPTPSALAQVDVPVRESSSSPPQPDIRSRWPCRMRGRGARARDDYLRGKPSALSANELEGLKIFTNIGCMVCRTGEFVGGAMYQKVGIVEEWLNQKDQGRYEVTKRDVDRMVFKVPTLRNITKTAPYFHDGSVPELDAAVRRMAKHQLGLSLSDREVSAIGSSRKNTSKRRRSPQAAPKRLPAIRRSTLHSRASRVSRARSQCAPEREASPASFLHTPDDRVANRDRSPAERT